VVGLEALVRSRKSVPRIENEQFVQQRRTGAPMTDDKDRSMFDRRLANTPAVEPLLHISQNGVPTANGKSAGPDMQVGQMPGEATLGHQPQPREQVAADPDPRRPFARLGRLRCHST